MHFLWTIVFLLRIEVIRSNRRKSFLSSMDIDPTISDRPVMFNRIGRRGFGDVDYKQPINPFVYDEVDFPNYADVLDALEGEGFNLSPKILTPRFNSPRDEMLYYKKNEQKKRSGKYDIPMDFRSLFDQNVAQNNYNRYKNYPYFKRSRDNNNTIKLPKTEAARPFQSGSFSLRAAEKTRNWTTCAEFAKGAKFHPDDIVDTNWIPFYIWSASIIVKATLHTFVYPNKQTVQNFKSVYEPYISKKIKWKEPKLLMKEDRDVLLIAADRTGLFYALPTLEHFPESIRNTNYTFPIISLRLKIHDPYLALMFCDEGHRYATIMAEEGTEPKTPLDKRNEASTLNFQGIGIYVTRDIALEKRTKALLKAQRQEKNRKKHIYGFE